MKTQTDFTNIVTGATSTEQEVSNILSVVTKLPESSQTQTTDVATLQKVFIEANASKITPEALNNEIQKFRIFCILKCKRLIMADGWQKSKEATLERTIALSVGIEVVLASDLI